MKGCEELPGRAGVGHNDKVEEGFSDVRDVLPTAYNEEIQNPRCTVDNGFAVG